MLGICSSSVLVLHETLFVPVLMYCSDRMLWREERSRVRVVQMDNLKCMDKGVMQSEEGSR